MDVVKKMDEGIPDVAVLPESTIKFLLEHNIKQGLDRNRKEFLSKSRRTGSHKLNYEHKH